ncbi:helix-turn-helix domain-containing protein [Clostridium felsineum]|uniref:helix-turn-helix domain-containing protein n=1 Tax=Clostridium felsineum TaxID=36839 RepID=UPI00214D56E9|nr:helix-turn-helix transcriptional regulator [Clostridium felsineum]MCR3760438.1 helix-turn-helix domain-containing protein [Clostridium felsineum]
MDNKLLKTENETFGEYIKRIRELRGYSQRRLSEITGLSNTTISRIEKGSIENSDTDTVVKLANGLDLNKEELLITAGYLDNKKENTQLESIKDYIKLGLKNLGWINSYDDINEETRKEINTTFF